MDKRKILNRDIILQVEQIKPGLAARILDIFLGYAPGRYRLCCEGIAAEDWLAVEKAVHSLKSSAGQLGAEHLSEVCTRLEAAAEGGDAREVAPVAAEFESSFALTIAEAEREKRAWSSRSRDAKT